MKQEAKRKAAIEQDIARLMRAAAARPGADDPMGMVGFGATWLAATLWIKQEEGYRKHNVSAIIAQKERNTNHERNE